MSTAPLDARAWRSIAVISAVAVALFFVVRNLPTGTNLSHMDFRVEGGNVIEFCDPANPQFLPVVDVRSPVTLSIRPDAPAVSGSEVHATLVLTTFSGKPIAPEDLLVVQTRKIHLLLVDPSLDDYHHVHPAPGRRPGEWTFSFTPRFGGTYRAFADFTPVATNRGLYSETEIAVAGRPNSVVAGTQPTSWTATEGAYGFELRPSEAPIRARKPVTLRLSVFRRDGRPVHLEPVMGAFAHMVAFDTARSGFAHIHPQETDLSARPDAERPSFTFKVAIPSAGRYVAWAQVNVDGAEVYAPFWFDVGP